MSENAHDVVVGEDATCNHHSHGECPAEHDDALGEHALGPDEAHDMDEFDGASNARV
jgi:hypothetical protein